MSPQRLEELLAKEAELERLKQHFAKLNAQDVETNRRLRAALEPFARHADAVSLSQALGHIEREHLLAARKALEPRPNAVAPIFEARKAD